MRRLVREQSMWTIPESTFRAPAMPMPMPEPMRVPPPGSVGGGLLPAGPGWDLRQKGMQTLPRAIETSHRSSGPGARGARPVPGRGAPTYPMYGWGGLPKASSAMTSAPLPSIAARNSAMESSWALLPRVPKSFVEVDTLGRRELQALVADKGRLGVFVNNMGYTRAIGDKLNKLKSEVDELEILAQQCQRRNSIDQMGELGAKHAALQKELEEKLATRDAWVARNSWNALLGRLHQSVSASEVRADKVKMKFDNGDMTGAEFIRAYVDERKIFHEQNIKLEQFQRMKSVLGQQNV